MPSWKEVLEEIDKSAESPFDKIRNKYIEELSKYTKRNTLIYYSAFLIDNFNADISINDNDIDGFMAVLKGINKNAGLDLILHTPGGDPTAAEAIIEYLKAIFKDDIRIIVPHLAMSAGTMMACAAKEIIMGNHSSLGPIDPQFRGIPAVNILRDFYSAKEEITSNPSTLPYWELILSKYPPAIYNDVIDAIELTKDITIKWLSNNMLKGKEPNEIAEVVLKLNDHIESKLHRRHFNKEFCREIGLNIIDLEKDQKLQDLILSIHHCVIIMFSKTNIVKILANNFGSTFIRTSK